MNKKILGILIGIGLLMALVLFISAEENLTIQENSQEESSANDAFIYLSLDSQTISDEISTDIPNEEDESNYSPLNVGESILSSEINILEGINETNNSESSNESRNAEGPYLGNISSDNEGESNESIILDMNISQPENSSSDNSNSGGNSEQDVYSLNSNYLNLSNSTQNNSQEDSENSENTEQEKEEDNCSLQSPGKRIEIKDCRGVNILGIEVEEFERNGLEKEVIISSEEDINKTITINTTLTTESKKENIHIYWKNEGNLEITDLEDFSVKYYDEDSNGLIDIVSWDIPHLSEQIFEVVVELNKSDVSVERLLLDVIGPTGQARNPINFDINVNYSGNFSCNLKVGDEWLYNFSTNQTYSLSLPNGNYIWEVYCFDVSASLLNVTSGNFSVNEGFYSSLQEGKLYFLDLVENKIKNPEIIIINSTNPSNFVIKIIRDGQVIYTKNSSNYAALIMNESILNSSGIYNLSVNFDEPSPKVLLMTNFSVASANLLFNTTQIKEGESVKITAIVNSPIRKIAPVILDYGDGSSPSFSLTETNQFNQYFSKKYSQDGKYTVNLSATILGVTTFTIQKNGINVSDNPTGSSNTDSASPSISLLEPNDEAIIYGSAVNFSYKASDSVKIQNCTFKLYENCASMSYCSTSSSNLIFPTNSQQNSIANNYSVQNNKKVEVNLKDFEDGIYEWLVECYDNSSNYDWEVGFFKIINENSSEKLENYSQKEEIEDLKGQADSFLTKDFNLEEKEVLEDLNLLNETRYYKKRLLDIEQFFEENYKYVSTEALRKQKTDEYLAEIENIKNEIPKSIAIKESSEYTKNSVDKDFESIVQEYFDSTNTQIGKSSIQKLARINKELQNEISVSTKVKSIEIEYANGTSKLTLVKKGLNLNNDSYNKILEIIPKEIAESAEEITFLTENNVINGDPIFEVNYENLEKKEIIYYINKSVKLKEFEKTDTLLFEDNLNKFEGGFTGFFIADLGSLDFTLYFIIAFILVVVLLFIVPFVFKKFKILNWRKEPNVVRVMNLIEDIQRLLKEKEIENAREKYYKIKEIYPLLPNKTKSYFYEKINEMLIKIDRKDIFGLVKEYQEAKRKWNKEDYMRLYEDIKKIYERLPEKDRKKVYDIINGY
jgi:hypothetical protein